MKKHVLTAYKFLVALILIAAIVFLSLTLPKLDEIVTQNITLKHFEKTMNNFDSKTLHQFVADSENDILYTNIVKKYEINHTNTVKEAKFNIDNYEMFGNGQYQCYLNYHNIPTCDVNYKGKYMNYLLDTTTVIKYKDGSQQIKKERGLVVFVKDGSNGNIFEWKLVRYDVKSIIE